MSELVFVDTTNNHNVVLAKGKPESIEDDVQYYFFKCSKCDGGCTSQPQFWNKKGLYCANCASKIGFDNLSHYSSNEKLLSVYDGCSCSTCIYRRSNHA